MATTFELITKVEVGVLGAADITFSAIPATFTDLCIVLSARSARLANDRDELFIQVGNGTIDTGANYSVRELRTIDSATPTSVSSSSQTSIIRGGMPAASATASTFGSTSIYIPNYAGSTAKSFSIDFVTENNASGGIQGLDAALWSGTSAITTIKLRPEVSTFVQYTNAYLYGVKNA